MCWTNFWVGYVSVCFTMFWCRLLETMEFHGSNCLSFLALKKKNGWVIQCSKSRKALVRRKKGASKLVSSFSFFILNISSPPPKFECEMNTWKRRIKIKVTTKSNNYWQITSQTQSWMFKVQASIRKSTCLRVAVYSRKREKQLIL